MVTSLCAKCGACSTVCPVYRVSGLESDTARGKLHLLGKLAASPHSPAYREIFSRCLLCGGCHRACPRGLDLPALVATARADFPRLTGSGAFAKFLAANCLSHPLLLGGVAGMIKAFGPLLRQLPSDSGLRLKLGLFTEPPEPLPRAEENAVAHRPGPESPSGAITIFSGCLARHLRPEITRATASLLNHAGYPDPQTPTGQTCCGLAAYSAGNPSEARRLARQNLDAMAHLDGPIVTPCGSCYDHLLSYPTLLADDPHYLDLALAFTSRLQELSGLLAAAPGAPSTALPRPGQPPVRIYHHDPCHLRAHPTLGAAARQLLHSQPGVEVVELPGGPRCCGLGGTFHLAHPNLSRQIGDSLANEIIALAPDLVVTSCSGCLIQLSRILAEEGGAIPVRHTSEFLARCRTRKWRLLS